MPMVSRPASTPQPLRPTPSAPPLAHIQRRAGHAWLLRAAKPLLSLGLLKARVGLALERTLGRVAQPTEGVTVFQAYMVGDFFMALPALRRLRQQLPAHWTLRLLCRPDCVPIAQGEGLEAMAFRHPWFMGNGLRALITSAWQAWSLRRLATTWALDTDADARTGWLLRLMGHGRVVSYVRPHAAFFHETFALPGKPVHQSEKNFAVVAGFLAQLEAHRQTEESRAPTPFDVWQALENAALEDRSSQEPTSHGKEGEGPRIWIMAVTRKDTKNWPLAHWDALLQRLYHAHERFALVDVPDGGPEWKGFAQRWEQRIPLVRMALPDLWRALHDPTQGITHVITLDNFFGHMAAYAGKRVLWLNGSSDPMAVRPLAWEPVLGAGGERGSAEGGGNGTGMDRSRNGSEKDDRGRSSDDGAKGIVGVTDENIENEDGAAEYASHWRLRRDGEAEVVQLEPMPCRPCGHRCTEARHAHCLSDLDVEVVWARVQAFLRREAARSEAEPG